MKNQANNKRVPFSVYFIIALVTASISLAGCHRWHKKTPEAKISCMKDHISDDLDLTSEQNKNLDELADLATTIYKKLHKDRIDDLQMMVEQVQGKTLDQENLTQRFTSKIDYIKEKLPTIIAKIAKLHESLTAEQKAQLGEHFRDKLEDIKDK